jgi:hypothetical protein
MNMAKVITHALIHAYYLSTTNNMELDKPYWNIISSIIVTNYRASFLYK